MKKGFMYLMLIFSILFGAVTSAGAQSKALEKDVKKRVKELKKEGWKMQASTSTLDYAMLKYRMYMEEDEENRIALTGIAIGKNVKIGRENAIMNAITSYAGRAKAQVVGKMKSLVSSDASAVSEEEIDKFGAAYESAVNAKIGSLVKQHFVLVRDMENGSKEFNVFMSIDESKAKKAREEAALEAKKKSALVPESPSAPARDSAAGQSDATGLSPFGWPRHSHVPEPGHRSAPFGIVRRPTGRAA